MEGRTFEGARKYPRNLGSLQKAESVADRGAEEIELGFDIWLQVLLRVRKREYNPGAIVSPLLPPPHLSHSYRLTLS